MLCQNPVRKVVGLPLSLVAVFGHLEGCRHDSCVVDKAVQRCFQSEETFGTRDDGGKIHEIHLQKVDVEFGCGMHLLDIGNGCSALVW